MNIKELLQLTTETGASDLHLVAGIPPTIRKDGKLTQVANEAVLTPDMVMSLLSEVLSADKLAKIALDKEFDMSLPFNEKARFRVNVYTQKGSVAAAFRTIPLVIPALGSLGLPQVLQSFTTLRQGLILITGPTGHGKSTTLAAILNEINKTRSEHIVTVEDPIEFVFRPEKSIISQREMGSDTNSWPVALKSVLREDPDIVLVGEMRDFETISSALTIAETGHLVFATLHTNSAAQTIDRIVDVFPEEQQGQVRLQFSNVLEAVFSMRLVPAVGGTRAVAYEVMLASGAVKTAIREGKTHQIDNIIQTSQEIGMVTLEMSLAALVREGKVTLEVAQNYALKPDELLRLTRAV